MRCTVEETKSTQDKIVMELGSGCEYVRRDGERRIYYSRVAPEVFVRASMRYHVEPDASKTCFWCRSGPLKLRVGGSVGGWTTTHTPQLQQHGTAEIPLAGLAEHGMSPCQACPSVVQPRLQGGGTFYCCWRCSTTTADVPRTACSAVQIYRG